MRVCFKALFGVCHVNMIKLRPFSQKLEGNHRNSQKHKEATLDSCFLLTNNSCVCIYLCFLMLGSKNVRLHWGEGGGGDEKIENFSFP